METVLEEARAWGFLGPGPVTPHVQHATGFAVVAERTGGEPPRRVVDLGSGGGVPGLVLAERWREASFCLVDGNERRTAFLVDAVARLNLAGRVEVVRARAEVVGRERRAWADLVVARGFGPPAVTAECAAPLLAIRGRILVSEPPTSDGSRWPDTGLAQLGLAPAVIERAGGASYAVLMASGPAPERFPRRVGLPGKRPLW